MRQLTPLISVIIPNRNGEKTIGLCLEAIYKSDYHPFEVIVVDDQSEDRSVDVIRHFPCRLVRLAQHSGAAAARNAGAAESRGAILFFTDADCLLESGTLSVAAAAHARHGTGIIVGGTYTPDPYDTDFYSRFQSLFVNYSETKHQDAADYAAGHAMVIEAGIFRESGGFAAKGLPVAEDVEFSHRLRRAGHRIVIEPQLRVRHIFGFSLGRSLRNAAFKAMHWTAYSIRNRDILADSGTASIELKASVALWFSALALLLIALMSGNSLALHLAGLPVIASMLVGRGLIRAFFAGGGTPFGIAATAYFLLLFPAAVGVGVLAGIFRHLAVPGLLRKGG